LNFKTIELNYIGILINMYPDYASQVPTNYPFQNYPTFSCYIAV